MPLFTGIDGLIHKEKMNLKPIKTNEEYEAMLTPKESMLAS